MSVRAWRRQVVVVNPEIAHRSVRQIELQRLPVVAVVEGNPNAVSVPAKSRPLRTGSSRTVFDRRSFGQAAEIFCQVAAAVMCAVDIRLHDRPRGSG